MLKVITGTMKSGKSLELINLVDKLQRTDKKYTVISHSTITSRFTDKVVEADKSRVKNWLDLVDYEYILVDECQFLDEKEVRTLAEASELLRSNIYCFGILNDYEGVAFESMTNLIACADEVKVIESFCEECERRKATHHIKTSKTDDVLRKDIYKSVCFDCFLKSRSNE